MMTDRVDAAKAATKNTNSVTMNRRKRRRSLVESNNDYRPFDPRGFHPEPVWPAREPVVWFAWAVLTCWWSGSWMVAMVALFCWFAAGDDLERRKIADRVVTCGAVVVFVGMITMLASGQSDKTRGVLLVVAVTAAVYAVSVRFRRLAGGDAKAMLFVLVPCWAALPQAPVGWSVGLATLNMLVLYLGVLWGALAWHALAGPAREAKIPMGPGFLLGHTVMTLVLFSPW